MKSFHYLIIAPLCTNSICKLLGEGRELKNLISILRVGEYEAVFMEKNHLDFESGYKLPWQGEYFRSPEMEMSVAS